MYAHCNELVVASEASVARGTVIAALGNTGQSTGPHLHFEIQIDGVRVDPLLYLKLPDDIDILF